jgi:hypothetical protein
MDVNEARRFCTALHMVVLEHFTTGTDPRVAIGATTGFEYGIWWTIAYPELALAFTNIFQVDPRYAAVNMKEDEPLRLMVAIAKIVNEFQEEMHGNGHSDRTE